MPIINPHPVYAEVGAAIDCQITSQPSNVEEATAGWGLFRPWINVVTVDAQSTDITIGEV